MIGKQILHYRIIEKLGEGGMGIVYLAEDTKLKRQVAIKFLPPHIAASSDERKRFEIEAQAAAALNHANIATIHTIQQHENEMFMVMEYIEGRELRERINSAPLSIEEVINFASQIAEGLKAAHNKGIIHRDIKSSNIMVTKDGKIKIMDFGLAKVGAGMQLTKEHSTLGTAACMSPEQAQGENVDHRTDIWSFGIVLYEMVTGTLPFKGDYEQAIIYSILNEEVDMPADLPQGIRKILIKALAKVPDNRYQKAEEILDELKDIHNEDDHKHAEMPLSQTQKTGRKISALAGSAILITILIVCTLFYFYFTHGFVGIDNNDRRMLVVLPFDNIGSNPEQEYFADGMTEEMISMLGSTSPDMLGVIARTSSMYYKGKNITIEDIGRDLDVDYILEGSVRRQEQQVRITAKLIRVDDQTQLWSNNFDGTLRDILQLQSNVAGKIAEAIAGQVIPASKKTIPEYSPQPQAYEEYLTGRFYMQKGLEHRQTAIKYYEKAVRIDPDFAQAYAALAHAIAVRATTHTVRPEIAYEKAHTAVQNALRLNPDLAEAHSALAVIASYFERDWEKADFEFRRALELNPANGETYHAYGHYLLFMNRFEESEAAFHDALALDPFSAFHRTCLSTTFIISNQYNLAEGTLDRAQELSPELPLIYLVRGFLRERQGNLDKAIQEWQKAVNYSNRLSWYLGVLGYGYGRAGITDSAKAVLKEMELKSEDGYVAAMDRAKIFVGLGDENTAFEMLEQVYTGHEPWIYGLKINAGFDPIRNDPRFISLLKRMGVQP